MKKYTYQTCLRMSEVLKDEMTKICNQKSINESDFMRRAIAESIKKHLDIQPSPENRYMFL